MGGDRDGDIEDQQTRALWQNDRLRELCGEQLITCQRAVYCSSLALPLPYWQHLSEWRSGEVLIGKGREISLLSPTLNLNQ